VLDPRGATGEARSDKDTPTATTSSPFLRKASYILIGSGVAAALTGIGIITSDRDRVGWALTGAGLGLITGGATTFFVTQHF
jgi:hypothetical protein